MYDKNETKAIAKKRYSFKRAIYKSLSHRKGSEGKTYVRAQNLSPDLLQ